eukprot:COSAG06_NODE_8521_length_2141_cov_1.662096_2_plen_187_part_00
MGMLRGRFRVGASLGVVHSRGQQVETLADCIDVRTACGRRSSCARGSAASASRVPETLAKSLMSPRLEPRTATRASGHASGEHTETAAERPCAPMRAKGSAAAGYDLQRLLDSHAVRVPVARGAPGLAPAKQKSTESISCSTQRLLRPPRCRPPAVADGKPGHRARSARSWELSRPTLSPRCSRIT